MFALEHSTEILKETISHFPSTLVMLGSGWNSILDEAEISISIDYKDLFGIMPSVKGHAGKLVVATIHNKNIAFMSGRFHLYEGYTPEEITRPIQLFSKMGVNTLVTTAACGGLNESFRVGDIVVLSDVLTLFLSLKNPLVGPQFIDMSNPYDVKLREKTINACRQNNISFKEGVYAFYHGPNFESPTDKRALRILGADVCGMSSVPELLVAKSLGIKTLGLAFVTNLAFVKHDHREVLRQAEKGKKQMSILLQDVLSSL